VISSAGLLLGASLAFAAPSDPGTGLIAVLPPDATPARIEAYRAAFAAAAEPDVVFLSGADLVGAVDLVPVTGLPDADECDSRVPLEAWRGRFESAKAKFQLLAFGDALAQLVALDVELVCLATPPAASDLLRLELGVAEAHTFLAQAAGSDRGAAAFHAGEAQAALARAANFGGTLSPPADLAPEVLAAYEASRRRSDGGERPRVVVAGPGARVGARFNGRPIEPGATDAAVGTNLVEAASGAEVTAAARIRLTGGRTLVWLAPSGVRPLGWDLRRALAALPRGDLDADGEALLAAAARLVGDGARLVYLDDADHDLGAWAADGERLSLARVGALPPRPVEAWTVVVGAGIGGGWSSLTDGVLDGLGGPNTAIGLYTRVRLVDGLSLAATVAPSAVVAPIPVAEGGGTLVRATVPLRLGVRFGPRTRRFAFEGGVDAGVHYFGRFDRERMSFLAVAAGGVSGALGPHVGARLEIWGGAGLGYGAVGGTVGLEGRL
jgi:hypothetical protein